MPTTDLVSSCVSERMLTCSEVCRIQRTFQFKECWKAEKPLPTLLDSRSRLTAASTRGHAGPGAAHGQPGLPPPWNRDFVLRLTPRDICLATLELC